MNKWNHYDDVIMGTMASQITSHTTVYSTVYSDADQRKHQSSASLAFVRGIHRGPVNSPHKCPVTRKMSPFDDVIMGFTKRISISANRNKSKLNCECPGWNIHLIPEIMFTVCALWRFIPVLLCPILPISVSPQTEWYIDEMDDLTHRGQVTSYGVGDLCQHWFS